VCSTAPRAIEFFLDKLRAALSARVCSRHEVTTGDATARRFHSRYECMMNMAAIMPITTQTKRIITVSVIVPPPVTLAQIKTSRKSA